MKFEISGFVEYLPIKVQASLKCDKTTGNLRLYFAEFLLE